MRYPLRLISSRSPGTLESLFEHAGVDPEGIRIIRRKAENLVIRADSLPAAAANIVKQQLLSLGGDAAVHRDVVKGRPDASEVFIVADRRRLGVLVEKLRYQPFGLEELGRSIEQLLRTLDCPPAKIVLPGGEIDIASGPVIVGILNVTPDSFSDGGRFSEPAEALRRAEEMIAEGAAVIDVGGESSRPGARELPAAEEMDRVIPVIEKLARSAGVPISIDTRKSEVAKAAVEAGAAIINDISGLRHDPGMIETAAGSGAAVVIMHMMGTPETMQKNPSYENTVSEIYSWLDDRTESLVSSGIAREKIIIDPGIGFGKRLSDNLELLDSIGDFHGLGYALMVGYSRKSFLGGITGRDTGERLGGGFAALAKCCEAGVQFVRVHDVKETADFIKVWKAIEREDYDG
jgi:dihydropteroate synthase